MNAIFFIFLYSFLNQWSKTRFTKKSRNFYIHRDTD